MLVCNLHTGRDLHVEPSALVIMLDDDRCMPPLRRRVDALRRVQHHNLMLSEVEGDVVIWLPAGAYAVAIEVLGGE